MASEDDDVMMEEVPETIGVTVDSAVLLSVSTASIFRWTDPELQRVNDDVGVVDDCEPEVTTDVGWTNKRWLDPTRITPKSRTKKHQGTESCMSPWFTLGLPKC